MQRAAYNHRNLSDNQDYSKVYLEHYLSTFNIKYVYSMLNRPETITNPTTNIYKLWFCPVF